MTAILFVCLGNICRSPLAEGALRARADAAGLKLHIDSAGTGDWNVGRAPDPRAQAVAERHAIDISHYRARQIEPADFRRFTHIFALDQQNLADIRALQPTDSRAEVQLLLDLVPGRAGEAIADPYYGDAAGFDVTWAEVDMAARAIIEQVQDGEIQGKN